MVVVLAVALADFLPVRALPALRCLSVLVPAYWEDARVVFPAPVLLSAVGANVTAASKSLLVKVMTSSSVVRKSLMVKPLLTLNSMVPLPPSILKQLVNRNG